MSAPTSPPSDHLLLELSGVSKSYPDAEGGRVEVLTSLSFSLRAGDAMAVTGPSGSGKTTLLNLVGGLDRPDSGNILFNGADIAERSEDELAAYRNADVGFVFQEHMLLPQCDALENVLLPRLPAAGRGKRVGSDVDAVDRAMSLLERLGVDGLARRFPGTLSGGERQRVAIARALINSPSLILADEPTGALDRSNADRLAELLMEVVYENGAALLLATHSERLAERLGSRLRLDEPRPSGARRRS
jgi:lipoprotein-releasing system ATP-binding protein